MSEACILCYFDRFINEQLWQKGLCGGLLSRSMLVRLQSAVPIDGMMAELGLKQLLAKESKYLIRLPQVQILLIPNFNLEKQLRVEMC